MLSSSAGPPTHGSMLHLAPSTRLSRYAIRSERRDMLDLFVRSARRWMA